MNFNAKNLKILKKLELPEGNGEISICQAGDSNGKIIIHRLAARGKISNYIENYEFIDKNRKSHLMPLSLDKANEILERVKNKEPYSGVYIFYEEPPTREAEDREKSEQEHKYTSTGIKFWRHEQQMLAFKNGENDTVISTHVSPEGACNLKCPYCSVTYRDTHSRIEPEVIKDYIQKLETRGLKAVILTGGGEPTSYKYFNELVQWLKYERKLSVALITNGTLAKRIQPKTMEAFSWVRVSINLFDKWEERIGNNFDTNELNDDCTVGCSMVYTVEHQSTEDIMTDRVAMLGKVSKIADRLDAKYVRLLPNCLLEQEHLVAQHEALDNTLREIKDERFFHQYKVHGAPKCDTCHQSYFRPYLSEEPFYKTGKPGTVYPCDSVVLNDSYAHFAEEYQLCAPGDILDYLDKKIKPRFDPRKRCEGCVFTNNVNMLDDWKNGTVNHLGDFKEPLRHEEFV